MKLYKLTDKDGRTRNGTQWGEGTTNHAAPGEPHLCSGTVLHAYTDPHLAVLMAPTHVSWSRIRLWEAEGAVVIDDGTKVGCKTLTTVHEIPLPKVTTAQCVTFAILCAKPVCSDPEWHAWADAWLSGADRTARAAYAAHAVYAAAYAAVDAAAYAAHAAYAAAYAAHAVYAAAYAAADAADAAAAAAYAADAARAAYAADAARAIPRHAAKLACGILEMG